MEDHLAVGSLLDTFEAKNHMVRPSEMEWLRSLYPRFERHETGYLTFGSEIRQKTSADVKYRLIMRSVLIGLDQRVAFSIRRNDSDALFDIENISLADWDQSGRLVFAVDGKLFEGLIGPEGVACREIADFNANQPEPVEARIGLRFGNMDRLSPTQLV